MMNRIPKSVQSADQNAEENDDYNPQSSRYYCIECKRNFLRPTELQRHLNQTIRHNPTGARIHACDKCPKKFTHSFNLRTHQKLHSGSPDLCGLPLCNCHKEVCTQEFYDVSNFRAHVRQQHSGKFDPVPAWLGRAIERRFFQLKSKSNRRRRPIVKRNPGDFIHETFDASGTSSSSSPSQLVEACAVSGSSSFAEPFPPRSTEVCAVSGSSSFAEPFPPRSTEVCAVSGSSSFTGPFPPRSTQVRAVSGSNSFTGPFPPRLDLSTPISLESVAAGGPATPSQIEALWKMWDLNVSKIYKYSYPGVPVLHAVDQLFREPLVFPYTDMNSHVAREPLVSPPTNVNPSIALNPFASAGQQFFYEVNRPMACSFTDLLNDAEPRRYDTTTTLPFFYNGSHDGAGWIG